MSQTFYNVLEQYLRQLQSQRADFAKVIKPPSVPPKAVHDRLVAAAGAAPDELISWFSWQDGIEIPANADPLRPLPAMLGAYIPAGLNESLKYAPLLRPRFQIPDQQLNPWVPIAFDHPRTLLFNVDTGAVYRLLDWERNDQIAESISELIGAWSEFIDKEGFWDSASGQWKTRSLWSDLDKSLMARIGYSS